jgi:hypothetical protein
VNLGVPCHPVISQAKQLGTEYVDLVVGFDAAPLGCIAPAETKPQSPTPDCWLRACIPIVKSATVVEHSFPFPFRSSPLAASIRVSLDPSTASSLGAAAAVLPLSKLPPHRPLAPPQSPFLLALPWLRPLAPPQSPYLLALPWLPLFSPQFPLSLDPFTLSSRRN